MHQRNASLPRIFVLGVLLASSSGDCQTKERQAPQVEALTAISVAYVQVQLTVTNHDDPLILLPTCGEFEICSAYAFLEQRDSVKGGWHRTSPKAFGDVVFGQVIKLERGQSTHAVFRFNPKDWPLTDATAINTASKVRVGLVVWRDELGVGDLRKAIEVRTAEFQIPAFPQTWESKGLIR